MLEDLYLLSNAEGEALLRVKGGAWGEVGRGRLRSTRVEPRYI